MKNFLVKTLALAAALVVSAGARAQFTSVSYGNNLELAPAKDYASQFRYLSEAELSKAALVPRTDLPADVQAEWSVEPKYFMKGIKINPKTGVISFSKGAYRANSIGIAMVTATAWKGTPQQATVSVPVFFNFPVTSPRTDKLDFGYMVTYTPFVLHANPEKGGKSGPATIAGEGFDASSFSMDYRRNHHYVNFSGPASHDGLLGTPEQDQGKLLYQMWDATFQAQGKAVNTGDKRVVSYFANKKNLSVPACYVDNADGWRVVVNPGKWKDGGGVWANGAYIGQMTYTDHPGGEEVNNGQMYYPLVIWLDDKL